jgi:hypothetical protein
MILTFIDRWSMNGWIDEWVDGWVDRKMDYYGDDDDR